MHDLLLSPVTPTVGNRVVGFNVIDANTLQTGTTMVTTSPIIAVTGSVPSAPDHKLYEVVTKSHHIYMVLVPNT